jgi:excisionase family DNA binding protein
MRATGGRAVQRVIGTPILWREGADTEVGSPTPLPDGKGLLDLDVPVHEIPALLVKLAAAQASLQARLLMRGVQGRENEEHEALLEAKDVATWLGVKEDYVRDLGRKGQIPTVKIGKYVRFERNSIRQWITRQRDANDHAPVPLLRGRR